MDLLREERYLFPKSWRIWPRCTKSQKSIHGTGFWGCWIKRTEQNTRWEMEYLLIWENSSGNQDEHAEKSEEPCEHAARKALRSSEAVIANIRNVETPDLLWQMHNEAIKSLREVDPLEWIYWISPLWSSLLWSALRFLIRFYRAHIIVSVILSSSLE